MTPLQVVLVSLFPSALLVLWISVREAREYRATRARRRAEAVAQHPAKRAQLIAALAELEARVQLDAWQPPAQRRPDHDEGGAR